MPVFATSNTSYTSNNTGGNHYWRHAQYPNQYQHGHRCAQCGHWYAFGTTHYCPGQSTAPNVWPQPTPAPNSIPYPPIGGTDDATTEIERLKKILKSMGVDPEEQVEEVDGNLELCPQCEQETDDWDESDYICRGCRFGKSPEDDETT